MAHQKQGREWGAELWHIKSRGENGGLNYAYIKIRGKVVKAGEGNSPA